MAGRIRSIKPEVLEDEVAATLSDTAWRVWVSMWVLADDFGNCRAGDRHLAAHVWQDTTRSADVPDVLRELVKARRIEVYENGGERYAHIRNWEKHQRIDNAGKPRVDGPDHENSTPWPPFRGDSPRTSASLGDSPLDLRPPTNDHRPPTTAAPTPSATVAPFRLEPVSIPLRTEAANETKPKRKRTAPAGFTDAVAYFCQQWIAVKHPSDGKSPTLGEADRSAVSGLLRRFSLEEFQGYVDRYLADTDRFLLGEGHALRHLPRRIDGYRTRSSQRQPTHTSQPMAHVAVGGEQDL